MTLEVIIATGRPANGTRARVATVRCAIYTRKSTDEGLDREFSSLDNQRESAKAYVQSQQGQGWATLPARYDDGGFSGASVQRPAFQRLLADIEAGLIDKVIVYKVDRLSRSLLDFAKIMDILDQHGVGLVSVTQHLDTSTSMGRLTLNMLFSFAQFERELIAERVRDKMHAARRRGQWIGGNVPLGYDVHPDGGRLVVNKPEAKRAREIFRLYLDLGSTLPVIKELIRRGWTTKAWTAKTGNRCGGKSMAKNYILRTLKNPLYIGKVAFQGEVFEGEHEGIVDPEVFEAVQARLRGQSPEVRHRRSGNEPALLQGLIRCAACDRSMVPSHTKKGNRRYFYYRCLTGQKRGHEVCGTTIPAGEIERFVLEELVAHLKRVRATGDLDGLQNGNRAGVLRTWVEGVVFDREAERVTITFQEAEE